MNIDDIIGAIHRNRIRITDHADEEAQADHFSFDEIFTSVLQGEIIENYPDDKPYPSCLIYGKTFSREPVHSVWAYHQETRWAVLITLYVPTLLVGSTGVQGGRNDAIQHMSRVRR